MGKMGGLGKVKIGGVAEKIYWIEKVGGRGRRKAYSLYLVVRGFPINPDGMNRDRDGLR